MNNYQDYALPSLVRLWYTTPDHSGHYSALVRVCGSELTLKDTWVLEADIRPMEGSGCTRESRLQ